jgi:aryl-alcohol dehydrogenase-like predicted oxidoreductase
VSPLCDNLASNMLARPFGTTGLEVSAVGLGTGSLGGDDVSEEQAEDVLCGALDMGVTLIDSARSYGLAEGRIGRYLAHRRSEFVLTTKGGYGADLVDDWTHAAIVRGIERALATLKTDVIDVFFLHSCPESVALRDDILEALERAREAGKIKVAGYSGEGMALGACVRSTHFGAAQCSVNLFDQKNLEAVIPSAEARGLGVIAKRPLANAVWQIRDWPDDEHADYWQRMQAMQLSVAGRDWLDVAVRWSAFAPGVSSAIIGTSRLDHLEEAVLAAEKGDLEPDRRSQIATAFAAKERGWQGKV